MPFARRDGVALAYEQAGRGDPPLVFIPGWCCDHTFFQPQFDHFQTFHRVTALDLRGCGRSDQPHNGYDVATLADDVAWLCQELEVRKPIVIGHSLGGMIAIELAARYPALTTAVVAVDPGPIHPLPETRRIFEGFLEQLQGPAAQTVRRQWIEPSFLATDDPDRKRWIIDTMCSVPLPVATAMIRGVVEWNGVAALALCSAPTLIVRSKPGGANEPARLMAIKPDILVGMTVGAGHFHQLEVPQQVNPMIEHFIRLVLREAGG